MEKLGTEKLKQFVGFSCSFTEHLASALADGKFRWIEAFGFIGDLLNVADIAKNISAIKDEIADLSLAELEELHQYVTENFSWNGNLTATEIVDASLDFIQSSVKLVAAFKKK